MRYADDLGIHGQVYAYWTGRGLAMRFPVAAPDIFEGVLHLADLPYEYSLRPAPRDILVLVEGRPCSRAWIPYDEPVLLGMDRVWQRIGATFGDVVEIVWIADDVIEVMNCCETDEVVRAQALKLISKLSKGKAQTVFASCTSFARRRVYARGRGFGLRGNQHSDTGSGFEEDQWAQGGADPDMILPGGVVASDGEVDRLRSRVALLEFELQKLRATIRPRDAKEQQTPNSSQSLHNDWSEKAFDYVALREAAGRTPHDELVSLLQYFSGQPIPTTVICDVMNRQFHLTAEATMSILRTFPYFKEDSPGWRLDSDIYKAILTALGDASTSNSCTSAIDGAPAENLYERGGHEGASKDNSVSGDSCSSTGIDVWIQEKWPALSPSGKRLAVIYLLDAGMSALGSINRDAILNEIDTVAADLDDIEPDVSQEALMKAASYLVSRGRYRLASRVSATDWCSDGGSVAIKLSRVYNCVVEGNVEEKTYELLEDILTSSETPGFIQRCSLKAIEDILKLSLFLGYEEDTLSMIKQITAEHDSSRIAQLVSKCCEVGELQQSDLESVEVSSPLDQVFLDTLMTYVREDKTAGGAVVDRAAAQILLTCLTSNPPGVFSSADLCETPDWFLSCVPFFRDGITVRGLKSTVRLSKNRTESVLAAGLALGFLQADSHGYTMTAEGHRLQDASDQDKWRILLSRMIKDPVFHRCARQLVSEGRLSPEEVVRICDGYMPADKPWTERPYTWFRDVLVKLSLADVVHGDLVLNQEVLES